MMPSRIVLTQMKLSVEYVTLRTIDIIIPDHLVLSLCLSANKLECESWRLFITSIDSNLSTKRLRPIMIYF